MLAVCILRCGALCAERELDSRQPEMPIAGPGGGSRDGGASARTAEPQPDRDPEGDFYQYFTNIV